MRKFAIKISTYAIFGGLLLGGLGLWSIYKEKDVNKEVISMESSSIVDPNESLVYTEITGGKLDLVNSYEYSIGRKKSDRKISIGYYTPILDKETNEVLYIVKRRTEPSIEDLLKESVYKGLLQNKSELPEKILTAYDEVFPNTKFYFLDTSYKPKTLLEKLKNLRFFFYLLIGGIVARVALRDNKKPIVNDVDPE